MNRINTTTSFIFASALITCCLLVAQPAYAAPKQMTRQWHRQRTKACPQKGHLRSIKRYTTNLKGIRHITVATLQQQSGRNISSLALVVLHKRCASSWCQPVCIPLQKVICLTTTPKRCHHSARAFRIVDLFSKTTQTVSPQEGSWWDAHLRATSNKPTFPSLLLQSRRERKAKGGQYIEEYVFIVSLAKQREGKTLFKALSWKQWPPILRAVRKHPPIGKRVRTLTFKRPRHLAPELTVVQKGIPSPYSRCKCKTYNTTRTFRLSTSGYRTIHTL